MSLNDEPFKFLPFFVDLNAAELKYYQLKINLDKCSRIYNSVDDFSMKIFVLSKTKDVNVTMKILQM